MDRWEATRFATRRRKAALGHSKALEESDYVFNSRVPRDRLIDLASFGFVERHANVLLVGPTGTGKSHLAQAVGHHA